MEKTREAAEAEVVEEEGLDLQEGEAVVVEEEKTCQGVEVEVEEAAEERS